MFFYQGEIALAFGDLLRKLWAPGASPVAPRTFKSKLARFAPQFNGFNQHDSQVSKISLLSETEFLFFLLLTLERGLKSLSHIFCIDQSFVIGTPCVFVGWTSWRSQSCKMQALCWSQGWRWSIWWRCCWWILAESSGSERLYYCRCVPSEYLFLYLLVISFLDCSLATTI